MTRDRSAIDLDRLIGVLVDGGLPGVCVAGLVDGQRLMAVAGTTSLIQKRKLSERSRVPIACLAKSLVALTCLELHVRGVLDIHKRIEEYLPELMGPSSDDHNISLAHLLSHTGGYVEPQHESVRWKMSWEEFAGFFRTRRQAFAPGSVWSYTQTGTAILGRILEQTVNEPLFGFIARELLDPIGVTLLSPEQAAADQLVAPHSLTDRGYRPIFLPRKSALLHHSISELLASSHDLLQIGLLIGGAIRPPFVSQRACELFSQPSVALPIAFGGGIKEALPTAYGLGLPRYGPLVGQTGSYVGTTHCVRLDPTSGHAFAAFFNAWVPGVRDNLMARLFFETTGRRDFFAPAAAHIERPLSDWAGEYEGLGIGSGNARLTFAEDTLSCEMNLATGPLRADIQLAADGTASGRVAQPWLSMALSTTAVSDEPYLLVGMSAFKRR